MACFDGSLGSYARGSRPGSAARTASGTPRPDGRLSVFEDTGHSLPRLRPEKFADVLRSFLLDQPL